MKQTRIKIGEGREYKGYWIRKDRYYDPIWKWYIGYGIYHGDGCFAAIDIAETLYQAKKMIDIKKKYPSHWIL